MKISKFCVLLSSLFILVSCNNDIRPSNSGLSSNEVSSNDSTSFGSSENGVNRISGKESYSYFSSYAKQEYGSNRKTVLPSTGDVNILVVPVVFKDSTTDKFTKEVQNKFISDLQDGFFGETNDTGWESVSSFYNKSSYGKLNLQGEVSDIFTTIKTLDEYITMSNTKKDPTVATEEIFQNIYDAYFKTNKYDFDKYDNDKDGVLDGIYMVYYYPTNSKNFPDTLKLPTVSDNNLFLWAFVFWNEINNGITNSLPVTYKEISPYCWGSYFFFTNTPNYSKVDAHTFIHESGHLLGLDDYYGQNSYPSGKIIMMDNNICDHDAFSKFNLGWIDPYVVSADDVKNGELTVDLKPFEENGDSLIVTYFNNETSLNEYVIVDYYTPTNLNEKDSLSAYPENGLKGMDASGIRMFHIDQRVAKVNYNNGKYTASLQLDNFDFNSSDRDNFYQIVGSNNDMSSSLAQAPLISMISGGSELRTNGFIYNELTSSNADLFLEGSSLFSVNKKFTFHNQKNDIPFDIEVSSITDEKATLTLTPRN